MANIYLDTNKVIDLAFRKPDSKEEIAGHHAFISPLSIHILCYAEKVKIPNEKLRKFVDGFTLVDFTNKILEKSFDGPTPDLEDNVQLHSASDADCDYFLTRDKTLLAMKFFGKTRIVSALLKGVSR